MYERVSACLLVCLSVCLFLESGLARASAFFHRRCCAGFLPHRWCRLRPVPRLRLAFFRKADWTRLGIWRRSRYRCADNVAEQSLAALVAGAVERTIDLPAGSTSTHETGAPQHSEMPRYQRLADVAPI